MHRFKRCIKSQIGGDGSQGDGRNKSKIFICDIVCLPSNFDPISNMLKARTERNITSTSSFIDFTALFAK